MHQRFARDKATRPRPTGIRRLLFPLFRRISKYLLHACLHGLCSDRNACTRVVSRAVYTYMCCVIAADIAPAATHSIPPATSPPGFLVARNARLFTLWARGDHFRFGRAVLALQAALRRKPPGDGRHLVAQDASFWWTCARVAMPCIPCPSQIITTQL